MSYNGVHRHDARRDHNEPAIVETLEALGFVVDRLSGLGLPDLLVSRRSYWHTVEVKSDDGGLRPSQVEFMKRHRARVAVLRTVDDVIAWERTVY